MRRVRVAVTGALMMVLVTAGCGSDDDGEDVGATGSDATAEVDEGTDADATTTEGGDTTTEGDADDEPLEGDDELDVCGLLADVDLEALLGEPAGPLEGESDAFGHICAVDPAEEASRAWLRLSVTLSSGPENYANQQELFGVDAEVTGLGDGAFHSGPYLFVVRGDSLITLQVIADADSGFAVDDADLETAMTTVLTALPGVRSRPLWRHRATGRHVGRRGPSPPVSSEIASAVASWRRSCTPSLR